MPIDTRIEDERGNVLATLESPAWLNWILECADRRHTVCLRFIDPYGDTVFNRAQMMVLSQELRAFGAGLTEDGIQRAHREWLARFAEMDEEIREAARRYPNPSKASVLTHVDALQALIKKGLEGIHLYLRFVGD